MRRSKPAIMLPALRDRGGWSSFPPPEKGRTITTRRTPYLPALLVVAAVMMACAAAVLAILGEAEATFLGKNGKITYASFGGGMAEAIYTTNPGGGGKTKVTAGLNPSFSPDGKRIACPVLAGLDRNGAESDIYTINASGGGKTRVTNTDNAEEFAPSWGVVRSGSSGLS